MRRDLRRAALVAILAMPACRADPAPTPHPKGLIVLGVDGMDPVLARAYMDEGRMPNLARIAARGGFVPLGTTNPPQSPVAWSSFITGLDAEHHGIYDFVHRDAEELAPYLSTSRTEDPPTLEVGSLSIPLGAAEMKLLRAGRAFWQILEDHGVPAQVVKIPANFPPAPTAKAISTSDMGTPDLLGTYGTYQFITGNRQQADVKGGIVQHARPAGAGRFEAALDGPPSPLSASAEPMRLPVKITVDGEAPVALIELGDRRVVMREGEWTGWIPIAFDPGMMAGNLHGMVRLFAKTLRPVPQIYVSPINLDPRNPAMPISAPPEFVARLAEAVGRFYTQGMAEDTKALAAAVLTDDQFLAQASTVFDERVRILDKLLADFRGGLLFFYVSSVDQVSHVFWRALEPDASDENKRYAHVIPDVYARMDRVLGDVLARAGDTPVVVMSDHGFNSYRWKVNLNTWLARQGYLTLRTDNPGAQAAEGPLGHIDWTTTQAYALGLNQVFLNLKGREPHGVVAAEDKTVLLARLKRELESWRHEETGQRVVTRAFVTAPGSFPERAPDLLIGYGRNYRSSDESAMALVAAEEIERNHGKWSGDHCVDPAHVPGVLVSTLPITAARPNLKDFAPTILRYFGVTPPKELPGETLFRTTP